ncbi:hypothetical protein FS594_15530 [Rahnella aquatilis]|nr:hypothetical protein FS594_15530 [Rahnella aquatilis]
MTVSLAMIPIGSIQVANTIVANDVSFSMSGYYFIDMADKFCETGMYYNEADGLFYYDEAFTISTKVDEITIEK